jgi:hypothetical protein
MTTATPACGIARADELYFTVSSQRLGMRHAQHAASLAPS